MKNVMGIGSVWGMVALLILLSGCGSPPASDSSDIALKVNGVTVSVADFNGQIKHQAYIDPEMSLTPESRQRFVDYLVRKELMIQEAIRLKMERRKTFVDSIETYWESTLIRELLDAKTLELKKDIQVTEEEMVRYYAAANGDNNTRDEFNQPYEDVKEHIHRILVSQKIEAALESWIQSLRADARIFVNPSLSQNTLNQNK